MHLDVNECETLNGGCDHQCKNTNGSYICECNAGFFLDGNGKTCSGISKTLSKVFLKLKARYIIDSSYIKGWSFRSSHRKCSVRNGVLRNLAKFKEKHLCQSLFFNKVAGLIPPEIIRSATLLKKRSGTGVFL